MHWINLKDSNILKREQKWKKKLYHLEYIQQLVYNVITLAIKTVPIVMMKKKKIALLWIPMEIVKYVQTNVFGVNIITNHTLQSILLIHTKQNRMNYIKNIRIVRVIYQKENR